MNPIVMVYMYFCLCVYIRWQFPRNKCFYEQILAGGSDDDRGHGPTVQLWCIVLSIPHNYTNYQKTSMVCVSLASYKPSLQASQWAKTTPIERPVREGLAGYIDQCLCVYLLTGWACNLIQSCAVYTTGSSTRANYYCWKPFLEQTNAITCICV